MTEGASGTSTLQKTGNQITGSYSSSDAESDSYYLTGTNSQGSGSGTGFTLGESGQHSFCVTETGNTVNGDYSQNKAGTDSMAETGSNSGGTYSEGVTGSDSYSQTETGNPATGYFTRTVSGHGTYDRTDTGPGATFLSGTGTIFFGLQESGSSRSGSFTLSESGSDRYHLLEAFNDVSNTGGGKTPGNMDFHPFGLPFVDPDANNESNQSKPIKLSPGPATEAWRRQQEFSRIQSQMDEHALKTPGFYNDAGQQAFKDWLQQQGFNKQQEAMAWAIWHQTHEQGTFPFFGGERLEKLPATIEMRQLEFGQTASGPELSGREVVCGCSRRSEGSRERLVSRWKIPTRRGGHSQQRTEFGHSAESRPTWPCPLCSQRRLANACSTPLGVITMVTKKALIEWIPKDQGGRTKPPLGIGVPPYSTEVRFVEDHWPPVDESWSLVVDKNQPLSTEFRWIADVHFLVEEAPHDSLREGRAFELYEGKKCVARGRIEQSAA